VCPWVRDASLDVKTVLTAVRLLPKGTPFNSFIIDQDMVFVSCDSTKIKKFIKDAYAEHCSFGGKGVSLWSFLNSESKLDLASAAKPRQEFYFRKERIFVFVQLVERLFLQKINKKKSLTNLFGSPALPFNTTYVQ